MGTSCGLRERRLWKLYRSVRNAFANLGKEHKEKATELELKNKISCRGMTNLKRIEILCDNGLR